MSDEPRIAKYGMPASESQRVVDNHFVVTEERALLHQRHFEHALRVGPGLRAALDALAGKGDVPAPVGGDAPFVAAPAPVTLVPDDLRAALGLR